MTRLAIGLVGAAFVLRVILVFLPELGRDEAAYLYWTHHPRLDYAPLFQLQLLLARLISDAPWFLRSSQLIGAGLTMLLFGQWLRERGSDPSAGVAAIATLPWLVFVGGILHPDGLLVLGLLVFALGLERGSAWSVASGALIAAGAKIAGLIAIAVALIWLAKRRAWLPLASVTLAAIGFAILFEPSTLNAARDFARIERGIAVRAGLLIVELALIGGGLLFVPQWRRSPVALTGLFLVAGFSLAGIVTGQVKANWLLPGLLLMWSTAVPRGVRAGGAVIATLLAGAMVTGYASPRLAASAESAVGRFLPAYTTVAGVRESRVASADSWADYLGGFHARVPWPDGPGDCDEIVSDDYGIACRMALACPSGVPVVVVPDDPLFDREPGPAVERRLIVAVRTDPSRLHATGTPVWSGSMPHPVTGEPISLVLVVENP
jgi:hypothetical protein